MVDSAESKIIPQPIDVVGALVVAAAVVFGTSQIEPESAERAVDGLAIVSSGMAALSLMWWRRWIGFVVAVVSVAIAIYLARRYPGGPAVLPVPLSMLALGYVAPRRAAWLGVGALFIATALGSVIAGQELFFHLLLVVGWGAAGVLGGQALAAQGERAVAKRELAAHAHEQALARERLRIAQDVHDSVAHAMATINVQSGVAAHLIEKDSKQAATALEAIRTASADALEELGSILGVLRETGSAAPLAPLVGTGDIAALVERARLDGVAVTLAQSGDLESISPSVGAAAYRAVQEALTNTRRHAGKDAAATVVVDAGEGGSLHVSVRDDGGTGNGTSANGTSANGTSANDRASNEPATTDAASAGASSGFGLVGMRERVEASGGSLTAGPAAPAGFAVDVVWSGRVNQ